MRPLLLTLSLLGWLTMASPLDRAMLALYQGEVAQAAELLRTHRDSNPNWVFLEARLALGQGELNQALKLLTHFLSLDPASVHRLEARHLRSLIRRYGQLPELPAYLALSHPLEQGQPERWQRQARAFLASYPDSVLAQEVALQQGRVLLEWFDDPEGALAHFDRLSRRYPDSKTALRAGFSQIFCLLPEQEAEAASRLASLQANLDNYLSGDSLLKRSWHRRLNALAPLTRPLPQGAPPPLTWSSGARLNLDKPTGSGQDYRPIWRHLPRHQLPVQHLTLWISRHSDWNWLQPDLLLAASRAGYSPQVAVWYFGDEISPEFVRQHWQDYLEMVRTRLIPLLKPLPQVTLLLEPEFNKNGIDQWEQWPERMAEVTGLLRQALPQAKIGLVMGDWLAPDQPLSEPVLQSLAQGDFVGSMLMVSPHTELSQQSLEWSPWFRTLRLSRLLKQSLDLPYHLAYLALPSQPGWQGRQALELARVKRMLPTLRRHNLVSLGWFSATDDPRQQGWFAESERHFGLFTPGHDPKAAAAALNQLAQAPPPPRIIADDSTATLLDLRLSGWGHWYLEDSRGRRISGSGDRLQLPLPLHGLQGETTLRLHPKGRWLHRLTLPPSPEPQLLSDDPLPFRLAQWQRLTLPTPLPGASEGLWLTLTLDQPLTDHLWVGVADADGFERSARAIGYGEPGERQLRLHLPLSQLGQSWRRYSNDTGFLWRQRPEGEVRALLFSSGAQPVSGRIQAYGVFSE
ncbi:hypothetical protein [Ferrimonas sp. YFM]|uniref:tetratricopeptide repeat protein n=1 Tax=Ferrimonas sp. YFM TaxID=3028878 RepID=UPI0025741754|nr:hypothetical protein [Ferrimonas sp. YFM]BDY03428.1 hypothetical protein F0521_04690 [Ferrimonas sp. YFM]